MKESELKDYITGFLDSSKGERWFIKKVNSNLSNRGRDAEIIIKLEWLGNKKENK